MRFRAVITALAGLPSIFATPPPGQHNGIETVSARSAIVADEAVNTAEMRHSLRFDTRHAEAEYDCNNDHDWKHGPMDGENGWCYEKSDDDKKCQFVTDLWVSGIIV